MPCDWMECQTGKLQTLQPVELLSFKNELRKITISHVLAYSELSRLFRYKKRRDERI